MGHRIESGTCKSNWIDSGNQIPSPSRYNIIKCNKNEKNMKAKAAENCLSNDTLDIGICSYWDLFCLYTYLFLNVPLSSLWMKNKNLISSKLFPLYDAMTFPPFVSKYYHFFYQMPEILQTILRLNEYPLMEAKGGNLAFSPNGQLHTWGFQTCSVGVSNNHLFPHRFLVAHLTHVVCPHTAYVALFKKAKKRKTLEFGLLSKLGVKKINIGLISIFVSFWHIYSPSSHVN